MWALAQVPGTRSCVSSCSQTYLNTPGAACLILLLRCDFVRPESLITHSTHSLIQCADNNRTLTPLHLPKTEETAAVNALPTPSAPTYAAARTLTRKGTFTLLGWDKATFLLYIAAVQLVLMLLLIAFTWNQSVTLAELRAGKAGTPLFFRL